MRLRIDSRDIDNVETAIRIHELESVIRKILEEVDGIDKPVDSDSYLPFSLIEELVETLKKGSIR